MERNIRVVAKGHPTSGDGGTHNLLRIAVSWRKRDGAVTLEVSIPPNTTATLVLPVSQPEGITESGKPVAQAPGIKVAVARDGATALELGSGKYAFAWKFHEQAGDKKP